MGHYPTGNAPFFWDSNFMAASTPRSTKNRPWLIFFGFLSIAICIVMAILAYLFFTLRVSTTTGTVQITATPRPPVLTLPTASSATITPGPLPPQEIKFVPVEPITGFSSCHNYGVKGSVTASNGKALQGVQIVVWEDQTGLLGLKITDTEGNYSVEVTDEPALRQLWVQVYENDLPVSESVLVETQIDCQLGFQIYQLDWQSVAQ
jgi:hypothetical protein